MCKDLKADFLVSETVALHLPAEIKTDRLGVVKIRGREESVGIFRVDASS